MTTASITRQQKIKARSTGSPELSGADAFARLLAASMAKAPALHIVKPDDDAESAPPNMKRNRG